MPNSKKMRCPICDDILMDPSRLATHLTRKHADCIPPDMSVEQYVYFLRTGKKHGSCVMCKEPTDWNPVTGKYARFCNNPKCKEKYKQVFQKRMIGKYGKVNLLNDPEQQRKMLENRRISGTYVWSTDPNVKLTYTGTYERDLLEFLDKVLEFDPHDILAPSPHTYVYIYEGEKHFYIPDLFIPSLGLEIEVKTHENMHHKIQAVDNVKEQLKDDVMRSNKNTYDYIKVVDKNYNVLLDYFQASKDRFLSGLTSDKIVLV